VSTLLQWLLPQLSVWVGAAAWIDVRMCIIITIPGINSSSLSWGRPSLLCRTDIVHLLTVIARRYTQVTAVEFASDSQEA